MLGIVLSSWLSPSVAWSQPTRPGGAVVEPAGEPAANQPAPQQPAATDPVPSDPVARSHAAIESGRLDVRFTTFYCYPDETEFLSAEYRVILDRPTKRLRIDRPGFTVICDGQHVLVLAQALPGRHLKMPLNGELTYERLVAMVPDLENPTAPGLILLLAESPIALLSDGLATQVSPVADPDAQGEQATGRYALPMQLGRCELRCEPESGLVQQALIAVDSKHLVQAPVDAVRFYYEMTWSDVGRPVDPSLFTPDLRRSQETTTLAQFLGQGSGAQPGGGQAAAGGQAGAGSGNAPPAVAPGANAGPTLIGMPLPEFDLAQLGKENTVNLFDQNKGVVVVEFFASWTKASTLDLPALVDYQDWCEENDYPVKVYAVAVGESQATMGPWIEALNKTSNKQIDLPVLLDSQMQAGMAMKLPTLPRTIVAVNGRVVEVYGGIKPSFLEDLKNATPSWSAKAKGLTPAESGEPAGDESDRPDDIEKNPADEKNDTEEEKEVSDPQPERVTPKAPRAPKAPR